MEDFMNFHVGWDFFRFRLGLRMNVISDDYEW